MTQIGQITLIVYGALLVIGGIMGYTQAGSKISLVSGVASGILELVAYYLTRTQPRAGFGLGAVVALILTINFLARFLKTGKVMPAGLLLALSVVALILTGAALVKRGA
jgi:uncharacterized membrane protein (UPF0136 family)